MQDDLNEIENLILENSSLSDISETLDKRINVTNFYSTFTYEFDLKDPEIKDYYFLKLILVNLIQLSYLIG